MASCTPGDIQQISYTTEQLNRAIEQTTINSGRIIDHENRLVAAEDQLQAISTGGDDNTIQIAQNTADILTNTGNISTLTTNYGLLEGRVAQNELDTQANTTAIAAFPGVYALVGGDNVQSFKVANSTAIDEAINVGTADNRYAKKNGDALITFLVADPSGAGHAVSQGWVMANYLTQTDVQTLIDNSIAAHASNPSAHHVYP